MIACALREATAADAAPLAELMRRLFVASYAHSADAANLERFLALHYGETQQARELADPARVTILAESESRWLGYLQMRPVSPCPASIGARAPAELVRIYVDESVHGRGVAAALMHDAKRRAREARADAIWLYVWQRAPRAIAFYRKCGFRIVGTSVFKVGEHPTDDWVMACALRADPR